MIYYVQYVFHRAMREREREREREDIYMNRQREVIGDR